MDSELTPQSQCPACGYAGLLQAPYGDYDEPSYTYCPCCWFRYGIDDLRQLYSFESWREAWITSGMPWRDARTSRPDDYDPRAQLESLGIDPDRVRPWVPELSARTINWLQLKTRGDAPSLFAARADNRDLRLLVHGQGEAKNYTLRIDNVTFGLLNVLPPTWTLVENSTNSGIASVVLRQAGY